MNQRKTMIWVICVVILAAALSTVFRVRVEYGPIQIQYSPIVKAIRGGISASDLSAMLAKSPQLIHERDAVYGWTPLYHAVMYNNRDLVKCLIDHGADVNAKPVGPGTGRSDYPIHLAVTNGNIEVLDLLLKSGARPDVEQSDGSTIFDLVEYGYGGEPMKKFVESIHRVEREVP